MIGYYNQSGGTCTGTGYWEDENYGTSDTPYWYSAPVVAEVEINVKGTMIRVNAIKATETMVELAWEYSPKWVNTLLVKTVAIVRRTMFSHSGRLPKRIQRIRRSK